MNIHKGDIVKIISGNDKGKQGKVLSVLPKETKILVEGVNVKKKHVRPKREGQKGELVRMPAPFPASRTLLICSNCGKSVRIVYKTDKAGKKVRVCKKCGNET